MPDPQCKSPKGDGGRPAEGIFNTRYSPYVEEAKKEQPIVLNFTHSLIVLKDAKTDAVLVILTPKQ